MAGGCGLLRYGSVLIALQFFEKNAFHGQAVCPFSARFCRPIDTYLFYDDGDWVTDPLYCNAIIKAPLHYEESKQTVHFIKTIFELYLVRWRSDLVFDFERTLKSHCPLILVGME